MIKRLPKVLRWQTLRYCSVGAFDVTITGSSRNINKKKEKNEACECQKLVTDSILNTGAKFGEDRNA
jgi:hypothetical protein